jgi:alcohol dehydrogenase class IV
MQSAHLMSVTHRLCIYFKHSVRYESANCEKNTKINRCIALSLLNNTNSRGIPLPCVAIPSSAGCGAACSTQTLVLNLEEGLLVPLKYSDAYEKQDTTVLIDPSLTTTLDANLTIAMALTALSNCIDALLTTAHKVCINSCFSKYTLSVYVLHKRCVYVALLNIAIIVCASNN